MDKQLAQAVQLYREQRRSQHEIEATMLSSPRGAASKELDVARQEARHRADGMAAILDAIGLWEIRYAIDRTLAVSVFSLRG